MAEPWVDWPPTRYAPYGLVIEEEPVGDFEKVEAVFRLHRHLVLGGRARIGDFSPKKVMEMEAEKRGIEGCLERCLEQLIGAGSLPPEELGELDWWLQELSRRRPVRASQLLISEDYKESLSSRVSRGTLSKGEELLERLKYWAY